VLMVFMHGVFRWAMGSGGILEGVGDVSSSSSFLDVAGLSGSPAFSAKYRRAKIRVERGVDTGSPIKSQLVEFPRIHIVHEYLI
jgi:hypothetical protein